MKTVVIYSVVFGIALVAVYLFVFDVSDYEQLPFFQRYNAETILESFEEVLSAVPEEQKVLVDFDSLLNELSFIQRNFALSIFSIEPRVLGFKGPFYSMDKPGELVMLQSVELTQERETGIQYLPRHVYEDYVKMMDTMADQVGRRLYVDSGYRSPGRQAYLFFYYLVKSNDYSLRENAKWIAMPGYSEHGHPINTAVDFTSMEGINGFSGNQTAADFVKLEEYRWLLENAAQFNFYLSYPENNQYGVAFEPWHWHWEKK